MRLKETANQKKRRNIMETFFHNSQPNNMQLIG